VWPHPGNYLFGPSRRGRASGKDFLDLCGEVNPLKIPGLKRPAQQTPKQPQASRADFRGKGQIFGASLMRLDHLGQAGKIRKAEKIGARNQQPKPGSDGLPTAKSKFAIHLRWKIRLIKKMGFQTPLAPG
jgi:hypothetical protein